MNSWNKPVQIKDRTPVDPDSQVSLHEKPPWVVSCIVHVALIVVLLFIPINQRSQEEAVLETAIVEDEIPEPPEVDFSPTEQDQIGNLSPQNISSPSKAAATEVGQTPKKNLREIESQLLASQTPVTAPPEPNEAEFTESINTTGSSEYTGGVDGAMDRLTHEIADSLREEKTLVVWLFDASLSLKERRESIANRFETVYAQLGQMEVTKDRALKTAVASYGATTSLITPDPVDDVKDVIQAVHAIKPDTTGQENVFAAVRNVTHKWKSYRTAMRRKMMIILVTDERGDDFAIMEDVIKTTRDLGIKVYCVGNAAPFGREKGYVNWRYEDGSTEDIPVDAGPETVAAERLDLAFWGSTGPKNMDRMSAGMGPWAMTRLCAETGGVYLISAESVRGPKFDPDIMREYAPDYRPLKYYTAGLNSNMAKRWLVEAARKSKSKNIASPQLEFPAPSDTVLRQGLTKAQEPLTVYDFDLKEIELMLRQGEKDRDKLDSPRWRASYDLAMGRVLALRSRAYGYNIVLADMKSTPKTFQNKSSNSWRLVASKEINGGPNVRKMAKEAREYLSRVVNEHPGTPWGMLAERELGAPLGWEWQEYRSAAVANQMNGNNTPDELRLQLAEEEKKKQMQKKMAQKKRVKPKL